MVSELFRKNKTKIERFYFVEESAERADLAENQLGKLRAKNRSSVSVSRSSEAVSLVLYEKKENNYRSFAFVFLARFA